IRRGVIRVRDPLFLADDLADLLPHGRLGDEVEIGVGITLPTLAFDDPARLPATRGVTRARHRGAELAIRVLRVFLHDAGAREPLLIAQLHAAQIEHPVLHGGEYSLTAASGLALIERADDAERQMQPRAAVADRRAGHQRRPVIEAGGRGGAPGALRHVLVDLAVLVRSGTEALDRGDNHLRVKLLNALPGKAHAIERT